MPSFNPFWAREQKNLEHFQNEFGQSLAVEIPRDLLSPADRTLNAKWLWIRKWYGRKEGEEAEQADKDYAYLVDRVFKESPENLDTFSGVMFNSKEEYDSEQPYTPGSTPD